jgi:hypothetical protein
MLTSHCNQRGKKKTGRHRSPCELVGDAGLRFVEAVLSELFGQVLVSHVGPQRRASEYARPQHRYSPAAVVAVEREAMYGMPSQISTSYVERSHLTLRRSCKRFVRLGTGFSKKLENHAAAVSLYVANYNLCRVHEALRSTPAMGRA